MKITAILLTYYKERLGHIPRIIEDVFNQTHPVDELIIINNNRKHSFNTIKSKFSTKYDEEKLTFIDCSRNFQTDIRLAVASAIDASHILQLDDDASIEPKVVENLIKWYNHYKNPIVGYYGMRFNYDNEDSPYWDGRRINPRSLQSPYEVDHTGARISLVRREVFGKAMDVFASIPDYPRNGGEDILTSLVNRLYFNCKNFVVPAFEGADWIDLGEEEVGLNRNKTVHSKNRDTSVKLLWDYFGKRR